MADNFGTRQSRVLTVSDRNLDNVIFQYRTPPLTCEWNLINQIGNEKAQNISRLSCPSGWLNVGEILQDWADADIQTGQVNCSASYSANTFKLFSKNGCRAIVNGWPLLIQGSNSSDDNNIIQLNPPEDQVYDFVFLEVWRKLIAADDSLYPYGNVQATPYTDNEVEWDVMGTETTKRVQIQYRIRSVEVDTTLSAMSDVFSDMFVYPIGGRTTGEYVFSSYAFRKFGAADAGLYISGDGTSTSETALNTVDGYVYAIPMFLVYRRVESDDIFTATTIKKTFVNRQDNIAGYRSDRPDGALADVVYKSDIVDFRHKVLTSGKDLDVSLQQSLSKLIAGELTTALKRGFGDDGDITTASSGGSTLMKVERINGGADNIPQLGTGSGVTEYDFKRRAFCNAEIEHDHNIIQIPHTGNWADGDTFDPEALLTLPDGEIISVDGFYNTTVGAITGVTPVTPCASTTFTVGAGSNLIGQSILMMEFTYKYASSTAGFKDVPKEILEAGKGTLQPIATRDNDVLLRFNNDGELLDFGLNPGAHDPGDIDSRDYLRYQGGNYTEKSHFGQEIVVYRTTDGSGVVTPNLNLTDNKFGGYFILGVKSVERVSTPPGIPVDFTVSRQVAVSPYRIESYTVTVSTLPNTAVRVVLYVGSGFLLNQGDPYSLGDSLKFFETNKQARGVIDTYELVEVIASHDGLGIYTVDTVDKPIIALATMLGSGGNAQAFAFKYQTLGANSPINVLYSGPIPALSSDDYSVSCLPTIIKVSAASTDPYLRIPVLVHSYVAQSETPYNFFYKTNAYQGILSATLSIYGKVLDEGPSIITTLGSGAISNYSYSTGTIPTLSPSATTIVGDSTEWFTYANSGDYICFAGEAKVYRILSVPDDTHIVLAEQYAGLSQSNISYEITRFDVPSTNISNVVDRLPSLKNLSGVSDGVADYECYSDAIIPRMTQESDGVVNYQYSTGTVSLTTLQRNVTGSGSTLWKTYVQSGDYLKVSTETKIYRIYSVTDDSHLILDEGYVGSTQTGVSYQILRFEGIFLKVVQAHLKSQDPMLALTNDFILGGTAAERGRSNFQLTTGLNEIFKLSSTPRPHITYEYTPSLATDHYKKVYQVYLFNRSDKGGVSADLTGRVYMLVISGEKKSSTINMLDGFNSIDTVDLFEMVGRPLIKFD